MDINHCSQENVMKQSKQFQFLQTIFFILLPGTIYCATQHTTSLVNEISKIIQPRNEFLLKAFEAYNIQRFRYLEVQENGSLSYSEQLFKTFAEISTEKIKVLKNYSDNTLSQEEAISAMKILSQNMCKTFQEYEQRIMSALDFNSELWLKALQDDTKTLEVAWFKGIDIFDDQLMELAIREQKKQEKMRLYSMLCVATTCLISYKYPAPTRIALFCISTGILPFIIQQQHDLSSKLFSTIGALFYTLLLYSISRGIDIIGTHYTISWYLKFKKYCITLRNREIRSRLQSFMDE